MPRIRLYLALIFTVLLSACAVAPPAPREAPLSYPPLVRERMLRIAIAEWEEWGRQVSDRPPGPAQESDPAGFPRLQAYWQVVPEGRAIITRNRAYFRAGYAGQWQQDAWSAAFISFVMQKAGIDAREFKPSAAHGTSIDGMIADAREFPDQAPFIPHRVQDRVAAPGDLLCADRSRWPLAHWRERATDQGRFRPMHCDIVIRNHHGMVEAIGGNIQDAVTMARFPTDRRGILLPAPPGAPQWFAIFENRLGRLPPWNALPNPEASRP
ncbi:MAG: DUF2272 domain-containing protein [Roseomonas sp.]|nr:DUF2272 domain-containing protein [Roseomonas sp.]